MESFLQHGILLTSICGRASALLISLRASTAKADEIIRDNTWFDPALSMSENKQRMKELGGARFGYLQFTKEMTIIGIAKMIEDLFFELRDVTGVDLDFWNPHLALRYHEDLKCVRNLNNALKHSRGVILDDHQPSNRALIDECGFPPNSEVNWLPLNLEELIAKAFVFQVDLISQVTGQDLPDRLTASGEDLISVVSDFLIPDVFKP